MIEIILSVCLITSAECVKDDTLWERHRLSFIAENENLTPYQFMHYGQVAAAKWINEHPGYRVMKISHTRTKNQMSKA